MNNLNKGATKTSNLTDFSQASFLGFLRDGDNLPRKFSLQEFANLIEASANIPDLQSVTDEGGTTTNPITIGTITNGTVIQDAGIGGLNGGVPKWGIDNASGAAQFATATSTAFTNSNGLIKPYKSYLALLNQSSTSIPVATVLENNFTGTITYTYSGTGIYTVNASQPIFTSKTVMNIINVRNVGGGNTLKFAMTLNSPNQITLVSVLNGSVANDTLVDTPIEIRVYN